MFTTIDKALAALVVAFLVQTFAITPDMTVAEVVNAVSAHFWELLVGSGAAGFLTWLIPNKKA